MLKLPKGLRKKKKGKKSKKGKEEELFTEEELEKYRKEHQQQQENGEGSVKGNEEWSKFKDLTSGVDSVLKKTQGDLDRIKTTSYFQRITVKSEKPQEKKRDDTIRPVVEVTEADFPQLAAAAAAAAAAVDDGDRSDYGVTDDESEEDDQDDIFDTSYVEAVERGDVKLAYVPDSPEECKDDDIFDTSHVDALIKGQEVKTTGGKKALDIGIAVGVLTGRIDNVTVTTTKRPKRVIPGGLLLESDQELAAVTPAPADEEVEKSILDADADISLDSPIDLSVSLHTVLLQKNKRHSEENLTAVDQITEEQTVKEDEEDDEFTLLAAESLEGSTTITKLEKKEIEVEPVLQESWSAFEADKNSSVFAESIAEDQIDVIDPYLDQDDPFDTSFADSVVPASHLQQVSKEAVILEDDDDFDPRADEIKTNLNNRRKSSVRIHVTDPSGTRESVTSDDIVENKAGTISRDLLGGSTTDLAQLGDSPLDPVTDPDVDDIDPFDTSIVDKVVAPGKVELKFLEQELIGDTPIQPVYRVPSDPDFDPRAEETRTTERRASRPENLIVSKSVVFNVDGADVPSLEIKPKSIKPGTPYYTRNISITEDINEDAEASDFVPEILPRTRSDEELAAKACHQGKRRHSEYPHPNQIKVNFKAGSLLESGGSDIPVKVLTPSGPPSCKDTEEPNNESDPFDTSFATNIAPCKTELKLLAKEFSCEDSKHSVENDGQLDLLDPSDDIFQVKALTPEPSEATKLPEEDYDPFDTSFAGDLNPGKTELKLLESEFLN